MFTMNVVILHSVFFVESSHNKLAHCSDPLPTYNSLATQKFATFQPIAIGTFTNVVVFDNLPCGNSENSDPMKNGFIAVVHHSLAISSLSLTFTQLTLLTLMSLSLHIYSCFRNSDTAAAVRNFSSFDHASKFITI